jgi:hypothetical protein
VLEVLRDGQAAQHGISELMTAQLAGGRHDPSHSERGAQLLGVTPAPGAGTNDFLECDDVGVYLSNDRSDSIGSRPAIQAATPVNIVGGDSQERLRPARG